MNVPAGKTGMALVGLLVLVLDIPASRAREDSEQEDEKKRQDQEDATPDLVGPEDEALLDELAFLEDAGMVESAARHRQKIGMSPSAIWVITREDIETSGATNIPDILRQVPGMEVSITTPFMTAITSRLFYTNENNHFLVRIDGRDAAIELLGQPFWEIQPVSLHEVERIEIIRGPGSALYGANALAGVVSITTRSVPEKTSARVHLAGGEVGTAGVWASGGTRSGDWGFSLSGSAERAGMFFAPRTAGKEVCKLRSVVSYHFDQETSLLGDFGISSGSGPLSTPVGTVDGDSLYPTLRLSYRSEDLTAQAYWMESSMTVSLRAPIDYGGIRLARFVPMDVIGRTIDAEAQITLPRFWDPLHVIAGGQARTSWLRSDQMLDADSYPDPTRTGYHEPGVDYWEGRLGAFVQTELSPLAWATVTASARLDLNTVTGLFVSPRMAAVAEPFDEQYVRLGVSRAFRMPSFMETGAHPLVEFPRDSPLQGGDQDDFLEFMTRVLGNDRLDNEELTSFEVGYRGHFLDERVTVSLELYYNRFDGWIVLDSRIEEGDQGLPDLERSSFLFANQGPALDVYGGELTVRWEPSRSVMLMASWTHREVFERAGGKLFEESPKNMLTLGGRFTTGCGLVGSLYAFSRSRFTSGALPNPEGLLAPILKRPVDDQLLLSGRLGWRMETAGGVRLETGATLFLPFSPFSEPHWQSREAGGGTTASGRQYGSDLLRRMVRFYLEGRF